MTYTKAIGQDNERLWATAKITRDEPGIQKTARKLLSLKDRYTSVEAKTGVPWWFIAVCFEREAASDFHCVLHNGERIVGTDRVTRLVPKGRGPFTTWDKAAIDALSAAPHELNTNHDWSIGRSLYEIEKFNGFGYRMKGKPSPYVWSHTNVYLSGKYVADGVYDPNAYDSQYGAAAVLKEMAVIDKTLFTGNPQEQPVPSPELPGTPSGGDDSNDLTARKHTDTTNPPKPASPSKAPHSGKFVLLIGGLMTFFHQHWHLILGLAAAGGFAYLGYWLWHKYKSVQVQVALSPKADPEVSLPTTAPAPVVIPDSPPASAPATVEVSPQPSDPKPEPVDKPKV